MNLQGIARQVTTSHYGENAGIVPFPGRRNPVFGLQTAAGDKVLKLARESSGNSVRKEIWLTQLLAARGLPVAQIEHADGHGAVFGRPYFVAASAGAVTIADRLRAGDPDMPALLSKMGAALARIHGVRFTAAGDLREGGVVPADPTLFFGQLQQAARLFVTQGLLTEQEAGDFAALQLPSSTEAVLCHGDFQAVQCIVQDGAIAAVVDWESAFSGDPALDLAIAHAHLELQSPGAGVDAFLAGYRDVHGVPDCYMKDYLPVRMACLIGLLQVWLSQGGTSWRYAQRNQRVQKALGLFRAYLRQWRTVA